MSHGDRFFRLLGFLLLGYALLGKGFAYLGVGPLFIGEITLLYGLFALSTTTNWSRILRTAWLWPLFAFMAWGAFRTLPFIRIFGVNALRDGAVWIWGLFAVVISSLLAAEPRRLAELELKFRKFALIFLLIVPITYTLGNLFSGSMPLAPWAAVPLILIKGGDVVVHLTGVFAYTVLMGGGFSPLFVAVATMLDLGLTFTGRAAMVTFGAGAAIVAILRPKSPIVLRLFPSLLIGFALLWILDIHITGHPGEDGRDISAQQIIENVQSIFTQSDNENLSGSKEWRLLWWDKVIRYTVHGPYFWTGKGFGINLADDDGFQVKDDGSLRSPHNGHITMLARGGVPGFSLWILCQISFAGAMLYSAYLAHSRGQKRWSSLFVVLFVYWIGFMANAAFDVYLESPLGGIWLWSVFGVGIGAAWIYRNAPETFADEIYAQLDQQISLDIPVTPRPLVARFPKPQPPTELPAPASTTEPATT
ncbi:MAG: O-antigen ligase family protein [Planctomycetota bacterium]|nr:O-antigen ligase family protein [Planctomycetota bacterium]